MSSNTPKQTTEMPKGMLMIVSALLVFVLLSVLSVVTVSHHSRMLFKELEYTRKLGFDLEGEASRISLEYNALASLAKVQANAEARLGMRLVTPENMVVLK